MKVTMTAQYKTMKKSQAKLLSAISKLGVKDLMEYHVDSQVGTDLATLFKTLAKAALNKNFLVNAEEISDGKYRIHFNPEAEISYILFCKGSFDQDDIAQSLLDSLVLPWLTHIHKG